MRFFCLTFCGQLSFTEHIHWHIIALVMLAILLHCWFGYSGDTGIHGTLMAQVILLSLVV